MPPTAGVSRTTIPTAMSAAQTHLEVVGELAFQTMVPPYFVP